MRVYIVHNRLEIPVFVMNTLCLELMPDGEKEFIKSLLSLEMPEAEEIISRIRKIPPKDAYKASFTRDIEVDVDARNIERYVQYNAFEVADYLYIELLRARTGKN